jgi:hypothetical protein
LAGAAKKLCQDGWFILGQWGDEKKLEWWQNEGVEKIVKKIIAKGFMHVETKRIPMRSEDEIQHHLTDGSFRFALASLYCLLQESRFGTNTLKCSLNYGQALPGLSFAWW